MNNIMLSQSIDKNTFSSMLSYGQPKIMDNGGKFINVFYNKKPLIIQTPEMTTPFGMHTWSGADSSANEKYSLDLSFKNKESRKSLLAFFDIIESLDKKLIQDTLENSTQWLNKKISTEAVVDALYTPLIKYAKDKNTGEINSNYAPTFRVSLPYKSGNFQCKIFDNHKEEVDIKSIETKHSKVTSIIKCTGIWVAGGKFGCSWKAMQVRVVPQETFQGYAFSEADNDDLVESDEDCDDEEAMHYGKQTCVVKEDDEDKEDVQEDAEDVKDVKEKEDVQEEEKNEAVLPKKKSIIRRKTNN